MGEPKSWGWKISFGVSIGAIVFSFYPFYMIIEEPMFASEWIAFGFLIIILGSIPLLVFEFKDRKLRNTQSGAGSLQRRPLSGGGIAVMLVVIIGFIVVVIMAATASTAEEAGIARISKAILLLFLLVLGLFGGLRNREEVGQEKEDGNSENTPMSGNSPEVGGNFCENCGNALSPDTNYCSKCGTRRA